MDMDKGPKIGFTGSRNGMTKIQQQMAFDALMQAHPSEAHHGCCIGSDEEFDEMTAYVEDSCIVVGHPPEDTSMMAECSCDEFREPKPYLDRNKDIVDETDSMIATPDGPERLRSGTWSTIRYARRMGKRVFVIWPSGETEWWGE